MTQGITDEDRNPIKKFIAKHALCRTPSDIASPKLTPPKHSNEITAARCLPSYA